MGVRIRTRLRPINRGYAVQDGAAPKEVEWFRDRRKTVRVFARMRRDSSQSCGPKPGEAIKRPIFALYSTLQVGKLAGSVFPENPKSAFDISLTVADSVVRIMHTLNDSNVKCFV